MFIRCFTLIHLKDVWQYNKQAGAELGQAQLKLGLDFDSIDLNKTSLIVLE